MPSFVSVATSVAELVHGENRVFNHSVTRPHSTSLGLFDAPGTEAFASEYNLQRLQQPVVATIAPYTLCRQEI